MKTIKSFITLLLLMVCAAVEAQTVVVVEKTDGTKDEYPIAEVDSVVYKPVYPYFYYAGWTLPTSEEDLAALAVSPNGGIADMTKTYDSNNVLYDYTLPGHGVEGESKSNIYVVVPNGISIYDADKESALNYYTVEGTIGEHTIYKSVKAFSTIDYIILF